MDVGTYRTGTNSLTHDSHKQVTECEIWVSHSSIKGQAVAQLVEALRYKLEGRGFDSR